MNILAKAEVHFHQQEQLSVYLESNTSGDLEKVGEVGLLTMFALRNLSNLGNSEEANSLGYLLSRAAEFILPVAMGQTAGGMGFEVIQYPGHEGRKRFYATFKLRDDKFRLDMKPKGFGFFGFALGYYTPVAVLGLICHLAMKRADDRDYLDRLAAAASACGRAKMCNEIGLANQVQIGGLIITATCGKLLDAA